MKNKSIVRGLLVMAFITAGTAASTVNSSEPKTFLIKIEQLRFSDVIITVKPGDTLTWVNHDFVAHEVVAIDNSWRTGELKQAGSRSIIVTRAFELQYYCSYHPAMQAQLNIKKTNSNTNKEN